MTKRLLLASAAVVCATAVLAQVTNLVPTAFSGLETFVAAVQGPASESEFVTSGMLRNTTGGIVSTATTGTIAWPTTSIGGIPAPPAQYSTIVYTGTNPTITQDLPPNPFDGEIVELVASTTSSGTVTIATTDGSSLVPSSPTFATPTGGTSTQFYYLKSTNTWYRMR